MAKKQRQVSRLTKKAEQQPVINPVTITVSGHVASQATRIMREFGLYAVVRICVYTDTDNNPRAATEAQLADLDSYIHEHIICRMPFVNGKGQRIYCRCNDQFTDECTLSSYQAVLDAVFGTQTKVRARIYRFCVSSFIAKH